MQKLILAHHSNILTNDLKEALQNEWELHICNDSYPVADMLKYLEPDAMIIDLNLRPKNGLTILMENQQRLPPAILATTDFINPYILQAAEALGIGCILRVPCSTTYIMKQLQELVGNAQGGYNGNHI